MKEMKTLVWIEIKRYQYTFATLWMGSGFYFLYLLLFQIGLGTKCPMTVATILWIGFILVQLLYAPLWFKEDNQEVCLFDWYTLGTPIHQMLLAKFLLYCGIQWMTFLIYFPLAGINWGLSTTVIKLLMVTLAIAVPIISSLLMVLNVTLVKGRQSFSLLALLLFPLILPTLIVVLMAVKSVCQTTGEDFFYFIVAEVGILLLTIPSCFLFATYLLKEMLETL